MHPDLAFWFVSSAPMPWPRPAALPKLYAHCHAGDIPCPPIPSMPVRKFSINTRNPFILTHSHVLTSHTLNQSVEHLVQQPIWCADTKRPHLVTLIENVNSQAISATKSTDASAFCRWHIPFSRSPSSHIVTESETAAKAKLRLAESKTMKNRSRNISRIFALADRNPKGFPLYSSYVM